MYSARKNALSMNVDATVATSCGRDRIDQRPYVQERMVVRKGQHPNALLNGVGCYGEPVALHGEKRTGSSHVQLFV